ncbi:type II toxin-antitoxin system VapB family antitoxin [Beggiatoa leptomitoformis]|uniref:Type II toxin-antitoxin system VapB family antitoxin n=2 Tax=Beggiatoa leptomitoformis TaxID=288004 RepID=A0A2N9YJ53_9GAMM|nr:type II toxin-antitoxin system VapB family antitoxin [Beggiatoa leptomitoformis]AUI70530.2 type II toxin-antitoxin system VapB family antitoxin [Beggiatoa leptomitoformis]
MAMNTLLHIDEQLIQQALQLTGLHNPQSVVEMALKELVTRRKTDKLSQAFGQYCWDGDLEMMRNDSHVID